MKTIQHFVLISVLFQQYADCFLPRFPENFIHTDGFTLAIGDHNDRIVGGIEAEPGQFPYQLSLAKYSESKQNMRHFCGGTIFDQKTIVTAAHCVSSGSTKLLYVTAGIHSMNKPFTPQSPECYQVSNIRVHENYNSDTVENDIALVKVSRPFDFSVPSINKVDLPKQDEAVEVGKMCIVSGWGTTEEGGSASKILMHTSVPVTSNKKCQENYDSEVIADSMICAGFEEGGKDSCQGDSGGPMVSTSEDGKKVLAGIVSWGYGCARPNYPGVYTRVSSFIDWINLNKNFD